MKHILILLTFFSIQFIYAQSMTIALEDEEWQGINEYPVEGKKGIFSKESMSFGEYRTIEVDRSWTKGWESTSGLTIGTPTDAFYEKLVTTDRSHKKQTYYFAMSDGTGLNSKAFCLTQADAKDFNIGNSDVSVFNLMLDLIGPGMKSSNVFISRFFVGTADNAWNLFFDNQAAQMKPKEYVGYLAKDNDTYYTVRPYSKVKSPKGKVGSMPFGAAGFVIHSQAGEALAAVSLIDKGVIYLKDIDPKERLLLATACAGLLLQPTDL
jgi:hypothetical protein